MGNFLSNPITEKHTEIGEDLDLIYGVSNMQGWRSNMEDAHEIRCKFDEANFANSSLFAVFDGHGGAMAAEFSAEHISETFLQFYEQNKQAEIGELLKKTFFNLDEQMLRLPVVGRGDDHSGCTAIACFVTQTEIICANSGDSRSVLAKNGETVPMSFDHKPDNDSERKRIEGAGGGVRNKRVNGDLAVSRALGDFIYKQRNDLPADKQQVSAEPDIKIEPRDGTEEFLIIACDGIWDVMDNDNICAYIRGLLLEGETNMGLVAEELIDHCLALGSRDNMSAIIVAFPAAKIGIGEGVQGRRSQRQHEQEELAKQQEQQDES